jgi:hypothetical protein
MVEDLVTPQPDARQRGVPTSRRLLPLSIPIGSMFVAGTASGCQHSLLPDRRFEASLP